LIRYRGQRFGFRELLAASTALSEGRGAAHSPQPISKPRPGRGSDTESSRRRGYGNMRTPSFSSVWWNHNPEDTSILVWHHRDSAIESAAALRLCSRSASRHGDPRQRRETLWTSAPCGAARSC